MRHFPWSDARGLCRMRTARPEQGERSSSRGQTNWREKRTPLEAMNSAPWGPRRNRNGAFNEGGPDFSAELDPVRDLDPGGSIGSTQWSWHLRRFQCHLYKIRPCL